MDKCRHASKFGILKGLQMSGEPVRMNYALLKESQSPRMFQAGLKSSYYLPPLLPAFPCHPGTGLNCHPDGIAGTCTVILATLPPNMQTMDCVPCPIPFITSLPSLATGRHSPLSASSEGTREVSLALSPWLAN